MTEINCCNFCCFLIYFIFFTIGVGTCKFHMVFAVSFSFSASTLGCKQWLLHHIKYSYLKYPAFILALERKVKASKTKPRFFVSNSACKYAESYRKWEAREDNNLQRRNEIMSANLDIFQASRQCHKQIHHRNCANIQNAALSSNKQVWTSFVFVFCCCCCFVFLFRLAVLLERINKKSHILYWFIFLVCISLLEIHLTELFRKLSQKYITLPKKLLIGCLWLALLKYMIGVSIRRCPTTKCCCTKERFISINYVWEIFPISHSLKS